MTLQLSGRAKALILAGAGVAFGFLALGLVLLFTPPEKEQFVPERILLPQAPVTVSQLKRVADVGEALNPAEMVLGVTLEEEARAYPINMLNAEPARKVVNDTLAGQAIAATF